MRYLLRLGKRFHAIESPLDYALIMPCLLALLYQGSEKSEKRAGQAKKNTRWNP